MDLRQKPWLGFLILLHLEFVPGGRKITQIFRHKKECSNYLEINTDHTHVSRPLGWSMLASAVSWLSVCWWLCLCSVPVLSLVHIFKQLTWMTRGFTGSSSFPFTVEYMLSKVTTLQMVGTQKWNKHKSCWCCISGVSDSNLLSYDLVEDFKSPSPQKRGPCLTYQPS